jgi:CheY-like chemotaxis protein
MLLKLAEMSARAAEQGAQLVEQLLAFGRRQPLKPKRFAVDELLHAAAPLITRSLAENIVLSIASAGDLWPVHADPLQTETALINLCINARDAMPKGGQLLIEAENASVTELDVAREPDLRVGNYVKIRVTDAGTGMPPEIVERMFEPFFTTKDVGKGTGLGLSMVYGFVRQSHGHISVTSEMDVGTTFTLYLPAIADERVEERRSPKAAAIHSGAGTVLIVEDHDLVREHACDQFERLGYIVLTARNGRDALEMLTMHSEIDLLFTDVVMSGDLSGFDLGRIVQRQWPSVRILYTSGYNQESREDMADDLLPKPYSLASLSRKVRKSMSAGRAN